MGFGSRFGSFDLLCDVDDVRYGGEAGFFYFLFFGGLGEEGGRVVVPLEVICSVRFFSGLH